MLQRDDLVGLYAIIPTPATADAEQWDAGVACARKSSTPDSAAIAAAVNGLSPVIMTVRIPI